MDSKVFIYLRLRIGDRVLARSKIREFAGLGSLLAQFLHKTQGAGLEIPEDADAPGELKVPILDYVDANTETSLISIRVDPVEQIQVIEGRIPPAYQGRMLDPASTTFSLNRFMDAAGDDLTVDQRIELYERLAQSQMNLLGRIRETMDEEGNFLVQVPLGGPPPSSE